MYAQYTDNVVGPGSPRYDNAYFTINYVRVYTVNGQLASSSSSLGHTSTNTGATPSPAITGSTAGSNAGVAPNMPLSPYLFLSLCVGTLAVLI